MSQARMRLFIEVSKIVQYNSLLCEFSEVTILFSSKVVRKIMFYISGLFLEPVKVDVMIQIIISTEVFVFSLTS